MSASAGTPGAGTGSMAARTATASGGPEKPKDPHARNKAYHQRKPWVRHVCWARRRCNSYDPRWRAHYLDQGVKCTLTAAQAEFLWNRDGAAKMARPSLDRIETGKPGETRKHYEFENCRFMEWLENVGRPHIKLTPEEEN